MQDLVTPTRLIYLPKEGLQGENIPSHVLWQNMQVKSVEVTYQPPLKPDQIFNARHWEVKNHNLIIKELELDGYIGLSFQSSKVADLETVVSVGYSIHLSNGKAIKETRKIKLFRPQLELEMPQANKVVIDPATGFVKGRLRIKNIGRGALIVHISATEDSQTKFETPRDYLEFVQKFVLDLEQELKSLGKEFPKFQPLLDEMMAWEEDPRDFIELNTAEREEFSRYAEKLASVLASDKQLLQSFVEAYAKALAKNTEFIESVRKVIQAYESFVSKDILLANPFDEVCLADKKGEIRMKILQTDRVFDKYKEIMLPKIELTCSQPCHFPIYRLFEWR